MALCPCDLYLSFSPLGCRLATSLQSSHLPGNTTLEGAEETKRLRIDYQQSGWIKNDWSHLHTYHTCMGVSHYKWHPCSRPLRQGDLDLDEHMTAVCKTEGESPVAVVPRRKWGSEIGSGKLGTTPSTARVKDHCCECAALLSVATSKFGNQQQNDQQLNLRVSNTSYVWDFIDTTVPKHISSLK